MFVLGVDPGLARCGYALLSRSNTSIEVEEAGLISTSRESPLPRRLNEIYRALASIISAHQLEMVVVERVVFQTNAKSAMAVGQALGMAYIAAENASVSVAQISSNEMKLSLVGNGSADKWQLQLMVQRLLQLDSPLKPPDVVDAIGLAYCYLNASSEVRRGWRIS